MLIQEKIVPVLPEQRSLGALIIKLLAIFLFFCLSALNASYPATINVEPLVVYKHSIRKNYLPKTFFRLHCIMER